jgi:hypothetical protein
MQPACVTAASPDLTSCTNLHKAGWPNKPSRAKDGSNQSRLFTIGGPFGFDTDSTAP